MLRSDHSVRISKKSSSSPRGLMMSLRIPLTQQSRTNMLTRDVPSNTADAIARTSVLHAGTGSHPGTGTATCPHRSGWKWRKTDLKVKDAQQKLSVLQMRKAHVCGSLLPPLELPKFGSRVCKSNFLPSSSSSSSLLLPQQQPIIMQSPAGCRRWPSPHLQKTSYRHGSRKSSWSNNNKEGSS